MRLLDIVRYVIKQYPHPNLLSKARLNKIIYLADWKSSIESQVQISHIQWVYNYYGPYVHEIENNITYDDKERFLIEYTQNYYGSEKSIIKLIKDVEFNEPDEQSKKYLDFVIEVTNKMNFSEFIDLVYSTYPIANSEKGTQLNLIELAEAYNKIRFL